MIDIQYSITIMGGREVSRPYRNVGFGMFDAVFSKKSCYHQGFFAVKRRVVFILGVKWKTLVRGWRMDCVVGGMETCF